MALKEHGSDKKSKTEEWHMGMGDLFWLFFMITALQPIIQKRLLDSSRQRLIAKIERKRGSRVILLVHRQETMSLLGFPIARYIDINDSEDILRACELTDPEIPVDIVLHTPGGLVLAALQIAYAVRNRKGKVTVFVPHYAMSGGTLIALAADEIVMSPNAVLGPVDPQLGQYPAASLLKVLARKPVSEVDDQTLILADVGEKAIGQVRESVRELMMRSLKKEKADELAPLLSTGTWTHDYPITFEGAQRLGLNVRPDMPPEILQLMSLYPQPVRRQPSVEYLPIPRRAEQPKPSGMSN
jgi:ClpP class serine protease